MGKKNRRNGFNEGGLQWLPSPFLGSGPVDDDNNNNDDNDDDYIEDDYQRFGSGTTTLRHN